jgi:uncharacterized paraquat-inducible protein A
LAESLASVVTFVVFITPWILLFIVILVVSATALAQAARKKGSPRSCADGLLVIQNG